MEPWKVVAGSAGVSLALAYLYSLTQVPYFPSPFADFLAFLLLTLDPPQGRVPLTARLRARFFQLVRRIPAVKKHVSSNKDPSYLSKKVTGLYLRLD